MDGFNDFIERMKVEKDGFAELWESRRIIRELETVMISKEINQATISDRQRSFQVQTFCNPQTGRRTCKEMC